MLSILVVTVSVFSLSCGSECCDLTQDFPVDAVRWEHSTCGSERIIAILGRVSKSCVRSSTFGHATYLGNLSRSMTRREIYQLNNYRCGVSPMYVTDTGEVKCVEDACVKGRIDFSGTVPVLWCTQSTGTRSVGDRYVLLDFDDPNFTWGPISTHDTTWLDFNAYIAKSLSRVDRHIFSDRCQDNRRRFLYPDVRLDTCARV